MSTVPRVLAIMGSGETSPTMVKTHRSLLERLGGDAVLLDTPYGFQENAADITARAVNYFDESVGTSLTLASFRRADEVGTVAHQRMLARVRDATYVFAGPGSPSYALRQWRAATVPALLEEKAAAGGCVTFASAAALTLGRWTVPVYEIYKVGQDPHWLEGLDLVGTALGVDVAVIPHFDNAEGGTHDTRYCYLGERRLLMMEAELPDDAVVLGVDEHTACVIDIGTGTATVAGIGAVTVRRQGRPVVFPTGSVVSVDELLHASSAGAGADVAAAAVPTVSEAGTGTARSPFIEQVAELDAAFAAAVTAGDTDAAAAAALDLEALLVEWARETFSTDEMERGRSALRSMVVRLAELAVAGVEDPADRVAPFVEALMALRALARDEQRWADADALRARLTALGIEVNDTAEGATWRLLS